VDCRTTETTSGLKSRAGGRTHRQPFSLGGRRKGRKGLGQTCPLREDFPAFALFARPGEREPSLQNPSPVQGASRSRTSRTNLSLLPVLLQLRTTKAHG
jgi:hypothetical protein